MDFTGKSEVLCYDAPCTLVHDQRTLKMEAAFFTILKM